MFLCQTENKHYLTFKVISHAAKLSQVSRAQRSNRGVKFAARDVRDSTLEIRSMS